jgi:transcription antitermination factor NusG
MSKEFLMTFANGDRVKVILGPLTGVAGIICPCDKEKNPSYGQWQLGQYYVWVKLNGYQSGWKHVLMITKT